MRQVKGEIVSSVTDLANYMGCKHAVLLDRQSLDGDLEKPFYNNPAWMPSRSAARVRILQWIKLFLRSFFCFCAFSPSMTRKITVI